MGTRSISRKLTYLCTTLSTVSQIDPMVKTEIEIIPEGTKVEYLIPLPNSQSSLTFIKQNDQIELLEARGDDPPTVTFQILTTKTAQQLLAGKRDLLQAIAKGDITLQGPPWITLAIIRTLQLSFPYTMGLRKTRVLVPSLSRPMYFRRRQVTYKFFKIFRHKKRHPVEKIT